MNWYYKLLVRRPCLVVLGITACSLLCILLALIGRDLPDFSNPTLGFEARGTNIGQRLTAWYNLIDQTGPSSKLVADPNDLLLYNLDSTIIAKQTKKKKPKRVKETNKRRHRQKKLTRNKSKSLKNLTNINKKESSFSIGQFKDYEITNETSAENKEKHHYEFGWNISMIDEDDLQDQVQTKNDKWAILKNQMPPGHLKINISNGFFCESPTEGFSHFVVERIGPNSTDSLFDVNSLLALCQLEQQIISVNSYTNYCQRGMLTDDCCKPWSIPNYVTALSNKTSCFDIDEQDVAAVQSTLLNCFEYFHGLKLALDCSENKCRAPVECTRLNAVYNILYYLADMNYIKLNDPIVFLKYSIIFVPIPQGSNILPFFYELEKIDLSNELVRVVAMDLGLKNTLFDECLISDGWLVALGGVFVMTCIWIYTSSIFVTGMTLVAVVFSLGIAYFVYTVIFKLTFFPFMNLLGVIVVIGIGADDAFIFIKLWQFTITERAKSSSGSFSEPSYRENLDQSMAATFKHAAISMFVTSLTTAVAFFTASVSSITAVKCFGIFAGTAVMSNYLLMITWLPASISIMERLPCQLNYFPQNLIIKFHKSIFQFGSRIEEFIVNAVIKFPILWLILLGSIGVGSLGIVLYWPSLQLPETKDFPLFVNNHPFEVYDNKYKDTFWFKKSILSVDNFKFPLRFVWGVSPIDDGDYLNPESRGDIHFDNNFNISSTESQQWLVNFCKNFKKQSFYQTSSFGLLLPNCFIENFISWMSRKCIDAMDDADRSPCCEMSKFPFEPHIFELCVPDSISALYATPRHFFQPGNFYNPGPKFLVDPLIETYLNQIAEINDTAEIYTLINKKVADILQIKAVVIEFESNISYSLSYSEVKEFVTSAQNWFNGEMLTAPLGMQGGWFISDLQFFDLQDTLSKGTIISIGIAMSASLVVLLFVTLNILLSLFAVVTVTLTIFTTVAILILLGWKLNILESVSISTAIGLAADFSLHYAIQYRLSPNDGDRKSSTIYALTRIVGPTSMAALTTGAAGAIMLASQVLPYIQIGLFLVIIMSVSWIYATFFLMSLLRLCGPQYGFMQFTYPKFPTRSKNSLNGKTFKERKQKQTIAKKQLLTPSSSAVGELLNSESHELDSLTSNSTNKQMPDCSRPSVDFERAFNRKSTNSNDFRSPSTSSAITVLPEDPDVNI